MEGKQYPALALFVVGLVGLGILALLHGDFALVWQPVPTALPARAAMAYATGVLMIAVGLGLLLTPTRTVAVRVLLVYLVLWTLLKVPDVLTQPKVEASWLGLGELTLLLSGGWTFFSVFSGLPATSVLTSVSGRRGLHLSRVLCALSMIPIGLSHIVYLHDTANFVPEWLPYRSAWAIVTGAGQIASGLGLICGVLPRAAAWAEAAQTSIYTALVWGPRLMTEPGSRLNWTAFFISWIFAAAAWAVAQNVPPPRRKPGG